MLYLNNIHFVFSANADALVCFVLFDFVCSVFTVDLMEIFTLTV